MKIHYLQHVPFEDVAYIGNWAKENGIHLGRIRLYENDPYPPLSDVETLIIMGGPMGTGDDQIYPWLKTEKAYIREAIHSNKVVIGICIGAQLIAVALGAKVYQNSVKEIGWFPVHKTPQAHNTSFGKILPESFMAFHWHGDTFDLPSGAVHLARSEACENQAFVYCDRVIGLQYHLETTKESAEALIKNCSHEIVEAKYIQTEKEILSDQSRFDKINSEMKRLLDHLKTMPH